MSKQIAVELARTARSEAADIQNGTKRTIEQIATYWNECVKQAGFMGIFDFPTTGYTRKAQLVADLLNCAKQLDDYCEPNPHAPQTVEQQTRELNAALTRVLDVEEAHDEALEENKRFGWLANRWGLFWAATDYFTRRTMIEEAQDEAIRINAEQKADPVICSIFQRNDGIQLALDNACDVRFIRTSKNGEWFKAGFRNTDMEGYQPVESEVLFTFMPSRKISFSDGVMVVSEA